MPLPAQVLSFSLCGEDFTYDLDTLDDDPRTIIEILKATSSGRGSWMTVAAHYRRSAKTTSAISVAENMITVLTEQGFTEDDLKPALLFLSGCETDLAKLAKATTSDDMNFHYKRSQVLLQKVYGTLDMAALAENKKASVSSARPRLQCASNDVSAMLTLSRDATPAASNSTLQQRQVQSLLRELKEKTSLLAETRTAKRKLEDDLSYECDRRRRLLHDYDELQVELRTARKMETFALSQVKREVEARRKAEEGARQAKAKQIELETLLDQNTARPFAEIANTIKTEDAYLPVYPSSFHDF